MLFERRGARRRATRLRPGKLLNETKAFLFDCAVIERSATGARIRAFAPVDKVLPETLMLYEEVEGCCWRVRIIWAQGAEMGLAIEDGGEPVSQAERHKIGGPFYAV